MKTVCFTGRRPNGLPWGYDENDPRCTALKKELEKKIDSAISAGFCHFISGMAQGVDTWAAEIVLDKKRGNPSITLEAAIPHRSQSARWSAAAKKRYDDILCHCDKVTYVSEDYSYSCMMRRNQYMVDSSSAVIAATDDLTGGSGATVRYAQRKGVPVVIIKI